MFAPVLKTVFRKDRVRSQAETLYAALAGRSRAPEFYAIAGAPDTPEGRFDLLSLHMFLIIDRLRREAPETDRLVRLVQEVFFERLDSALREMGVGDLSVGRKIRGLAEAFYGRYAAYETGVRDESGALKAALARNVYGSDDAERALLLADYVRAARSHLSAVPLDALDAEVDALAEISRRLISREAP
ncbi:MAG: ubiquinol-cytochrome C chaperone family protein [Pseudomonadota bacterium]